MGMLNIFNLSDGLKISWLQTSVMESRKEKINIQFANNRNSQALLYCEFKGACIRIQKCGIASVGETEDIPHKTCLLNTYNRLSNLI